ncbi:hypothetical protein B0A48_08616 [Cryoendolithus antarcticus]|uniref:NUDE domain-containing protein n=1 Tax=Cryoendolithus antarcticus TaxID=1507870 RepID=A0A1V8T481_9PEZI|nr:hypothetical protein B0A48_08616 [Cryoendolithus antarcticus]
MDASPRPGASLQDQVDFWKSQHDALQSDLADFQSASKDIEEQLEKDIESAEKSERKLKEQIESLNFQVDEWRGKHTKAKAEANGAQNTLQKEITTLREHNRALSHRLRDIEVANDDFEKQARNTTSTVEDLEGKLNVSIERSVLMEEEVKLGEQEREALRIDAQRLRDELSDLKVESEIRLEKLRLAEQTIEGLRLRKPSNSMVEQLRGRSPASEASGITPASPTASTPPSRSDSASDAPTPPSPPLSDTPAYAKKDALPKTPMVGRRVSLLPASAATPRHSLQGPRVPSSSSRHVRGPSMASTASMAASDVKPMKPPARVRPSTRLSVLPSEGLPRSESLMQMKSLRSRMQQIEQRVQTARSRLPNNITPRGSPRAGSALSNHVEIPSSITVRRTSKRPSNIAIPIDISQADTASEARSPTRRESHIKRLSYGIPRPSLSAATPGAERPTSSMSRDRPPSALASERPPSSASNRPSSRASFARPDSRLSMAPPPMQRPGSSHGSTIPEEGRGSLHRPRSSIGGSLTGMHSASTAPSTPRSLHRASASVSALRRKVEHERDDAATLSRPGTATGRRTTLDRSGLPGFSSGAASKRQSGGAGLLAAKSTIASRRAGTVGGGDMRPPPSRRKVEMGMFDPVQQRSGEEDLGETY